MIVQGYSGMGLSPFVGTGIGRAANSGETGTFGLGVQTRSSRIETDSSVSATFAQDIVRRIESVQSDATESTQQSEKDTSELAGSLAEAIESVRADHGDDAATAVMGMVYQSVGNGPVTEDNLGRGLLNALKLVDRQFGIAAGDKLMAQFNSGVNEAMNEYFDNGLNELFYASTTSSSGQNPAVLALRQAESQVMASMDDEATVSVLDILKESLVEFGLTPEGLRQGVDNANQWLAENREGASLDLRTLVDIPTDGAITKGALLNAVA